MQVFALFPDERMVEQVLSHLERCDALDGRFEVLGLDSQQVAPPPRTPGGGGRVGLVRLEDRLVGYGLSPDEARFLARSSRQGLPTLILEPQVSRDSLMDALREGGAIHVVTVQGIPEGDRP